MELTFGRYQLLEPLGKGGMAEVFKAKSHGVEGFEKVLVIKRILPELAENPDFVEMFIHEAKLAVRLSHANIVQVFDLGIAPAASAAAASEGEARGEKPRQAYFIAMEYVHGFDLATLLSRCRRQRVPLPIDLCVFLAAEVAKGLDHAHRRRDEQMRPLGIVHRDVSPQNVLLSFEGEVKVTDFGIAKAYGAVPRSPDREAPKLHGKYGYMSPEQARGEEVDARSDLYSLGIILYECLAGVNPFAAPTTFETMRRAQAGEFPPVELLRPDVPKDLIAILRTAMAKDRADRFGDAGRMYEALLAFLYAHGSRSGAHELADFLAQFRVSDDSMPGAQGIAEPFDDAGSSNAERTPIEGPRRSHSSIPRLDSGSRFLAGRAVELGERREISALVVDILAPKGAATADRVASIVKRYGGRVYSQEDEQVVGLFGVDEPDGRDTEVATRCALVILRMLGALRHASAGLHTGRVHVAPTGIVAEDELLTSLVAQARALARARQGRCAVSPAAARLVRPQFELEPYGDPEHTGVVSGELVKDVRRPTDSYGRFVGRKDELRKIGEVLASATRRSARVLTVRGDHGIGKTRLLIEVERRLKRGGYNVALYTATCPPRGREHPRSGLVAMLQVLCGVTEGDLPERILAVQPRLRALGLQQEEVAAIIAALGGHLHPTTGNVSATLRNAFVRMVASLCEDRPHVFAWDAAHCMDEESYAIVSEAHRRLSAARLVFAFAGRAGFSHPLEKLGSHTAIDLADLTPEEAERLVAVRLEVDQVPAELLRFVKERAGGHPLFIEEVLKGLLDARAVTVADRRVVLLRLVGQELALPKTLRGLVASRVARLGGDEKTTLQAAAVLGDPVDVTVLATMLDKPMGLLERSLAVLKRRDFLVHTAPSELRFTSPIVREVVVDALTAEAAREMHLAAGQALERVLGGSAADQAARIATHYYEAGDRERAAEYFAQGAARRLASKELEAAAREYARALELTDASQRDAHELVGWLSGLAEAVRFVRTSPEARETCDRVIARADAAGDPALAVHARIEAGRILAACHMFEAARQRTAEAELVAAEAGDDRLLNRVLVVESDLESKLGDFARSHALLERIRHLVEASGDVVEHHKVLCGVAQAHGSRGERKAALTALEKADGLLPGDAAAACERQKVRAIVEYFSRDFRAAVAASETAVTMARDLGLSYEIMANLHNVGDALLRLQDYARAYGVLQQSLALCEELGFERHEFLNRTFLAYLDAVAGNVDAEKVLRRGIHYAEVNEFLWDTLGGRSLLATLLQKRGDLAGARAEYERAKELAERTGNRLMLDDCEEALRALAS